MAQLQYMWHNWLHMTVPDYMLKCLTTHGSAWIHAMASDLLMMAYEYMNQWLVTCDSTCLHVTEHDYAWQDLVTCDGTQLHVPEPSHVTMPDYTWDASLHVKAPDYMLWYPITYECTWSHMMEPDYMWQHPVTCNSTRLHAMSVPTLSVIISQFHDINNWDILQTHGAGFIFKGEINQNKVLYL